MLNLSKAQLVTRACEDVDAGLSVKLSASKWNVSESDINTRIAFDCSEEGLDAQQLHSESQYDM
jgi:hypothetical protein